MSGGAIPPPLGGAGEIDVNPRIRAQGSEGRVGRSELEESLRIRGPRVKIPERGELPHPNGRAKVARGGGRVTVAAGKGKMAELSAGGARGPGRVRTGGVFAPIENPTN